MSKKSLILSNFKSLNLHFEVGYTCGIFTAAGAPLLFLRFALLEANAEALDSFFSFFFSPPIPKSHERREESGCW